MRLRSILILLLLMAVLFALLRPRQVWAEFKRIQREWNTILRLLVTVIIVYLLYGLYQIWSGNLVWWPFS